MQHKKNQKKKQKPPTIPLLELLAYNSTISSRNLLKKHNIPDAIGYRDLEDKLRDLYARAEDKIEVEKEFAEIHPHREFILKYLAPEPTETKVIVQEPTASAEGEVKGIEEQIKFIKSNNVLIASVAIVGIVGLVIYMSHKK